jgi:hypothetical protein
VYEALNETENPTGETGCTGYTYDTNAGIGPITVPANRIQGTEIPIGGLVYDQIYAIVITGGPWFESDGGAAQYNMQISTNRGANFSDLFQHPARLCAQAGQDNTHIIYIRYVANTNWVLRADSVTFGDNDGSRTVHVYPATTDPTVFTQCLLGYRRVYGFMNEVNEKNENGEYITRTPAAGIPDLAPGRYGLDTTGQWFDGIDSQYDIELSSDNGATWYEPDGHPDVVCGQKMYGTRWMAVFDVDATQRWRIRVANPDNDWMDNGGALSYSIYYIRTTTTGPGNTTPPTIDLTFDPCSVNISAPIMLANPFPSFTPPEPITIDSLQTLGDAIGGWIDSVGNYIAGLGDGILALGGFMGAWENFNRQAITQFFSWCERHTESMISLPMVFQAVEPFATIYEFQTLARETESAVQGYANTGGQEVDTLKPQSALLPSGGQSSAIIDVLTTLPADSPYITGQVQIRDTSARVYTTTCNKSLTPAIGPRLGAGVCFQADMMKSLGISIWFQLLFEIALLLAFIFYIKHNWIDKIMQ